MPESRDRLSRPVDVSAILSRRQRSIGGLDILADEPEIGAGTPFRWGATAMTGTREAVGVAAMRRAGRGSFGTPRVEMGRGLNLYGSPAFGRQNTPVGSSRRGRGRYTNSVGSGRRGRGRYTNSLLPSWYQRTPLHDVTTVMRAIERRRSRVIETEGQHLENPTTAHYSSVPTSGAQLEHEFSTISPNPTIGIRRSACAQLEHEFSTISPNPTIGIRRSAPSIGRVPKILLSITKPTDGESEFLTPQKKLLNSIDTVEKVVMEELSKLKKTPTAKKAEREKRVRTLMSMR